MTDFEKLLLIAGSLLGSLFLFYSSYRLICSTPGMLKKIINFIIIVIVIVMPIFLIKGYIDKAKKEIWRLRTAREDIGERFESQR